MNSRDSWIDRDSLQDATRNLSGLAGPPRPGEKAPPPSPARSTPLPVTRLKPEDFRLPEHFLPAPFPPPDEAERSKARDLLRNIRAKAQHAGLLGKTPSVASPAGEEKADDSILTEDPAAGQKETGAGNPPAWRDPVPGPGRPENQNGQFASVPAGPPAGGPGPFPAWQGKAPPPPRQMTPFEPPLGPLTTRLRALGDWIRRQIGGAEMFILDPKGQPAGDRRPPPALPAAALILAEAAHRALQDLPAGESGAVTLDLRNDRKFCVISAETAGGRYCLCLTLTEFLSNRAAERLRRALQRAVEPGEQ